MVVNLNFYLRFIKVFWGVFFCARVSAAADGPYKREDLPTMIVILKKDISAEQLSGLKQKLQETGAAFELHENGEPILRI